MANIISNVLEAQLAKLLSLRPGKASKDLMFENIFHALMECKVAQKAWSLTNFAESLKSMGGPDLLTVFHDLTKKISKIDFELMTIICWTIWKARNKYLFEAKKSDPHMLVITAGALMEAYQKVKGPEGKCRATKEESKTRGWQPPQQNCFKVNVDATISNDKQLSGLGVVIRDSTGKSIAAAIKTTKFHGDVAYAEEETASWGFQVAKNAGLVALIIETDSQMMADLINNRRGSKNEIF
ncbi:uncharacterized protein LOC107174895 [Citrus sinensis]|uniref:uncharacterized protein LOC107174895 n=2 Tax=Citrus TaxID=2706 RepID=UPI00076364B7|nr:uncharacterized protein LOC107174895 [Citrus sinensis]